MLSTIIMFLMVIALVVGGCWLYRHPERMFPPTGGDQTRRLQFVQFFTIMIIFVFSTGLLDFMASFLVPSDYSVGITLPLGVVLTYVLIKYPASSASVQ